MSNIAMLHEKEPKQVLLEQVGDTSSIEVFNMQVLVAVYIRPEKTKGGLFLSDKSRDEDRYQSKVGLILKKGPTAFVDKDGEWFSGLDIKEGDWIVFRPSDGWNITVNGTLCRMLDDMSVRARIAHPDQVW
jgi:co-chaperonin GroES (HSP10)